MLNQHVWGERSCREQSSHHTNYYTEAKKLKERRFNCEDMYVHILINLQLSKRAIVANRIMDKSVSSKWYFSLDLCPGLPSPAACTGF